MIDLGPQSASVRRTLAAALVDAGLEPVLGDGVEDALAGLDTDRDTIVLAAAMGDAERSFGQLDCKATIAAAQLALPVLAARQAGGVAVPELPRAWAYVLLCADRGGDTDVAMRAAAMLRVVGGSPDVTAAVLAKYPTVDAMLGNESIEVEVTADAPGATLFVDFAPVGKAPAHLALAPGEHVIAAASGTRRGFLTGTVVPSQRDLAIPLTDQAGPWSTVATKVASWHGKLPSPEDLSWVLEKIHARAALVRHGDVVEVWGHAGPVETPRRLGGEDGLRTIAEADRAAALLADRVAGWSSHAPDPDRPLLTEDIHARGKRLDGQDEPAKWWVYATIGAAILAGVTVVYLHHAESTTEHLELHYP